jgi:hypothetical protein
MFSGGMAEIHSKSTLFCMVQNGLEAIGIEGFRPI